MGNEATNTQETEFIFRRLSEALHLGGKEIDGHFWWAIIIPVLIAGLVYVAWMYVRDGRSVGWPWAGFLAVLRCTVYAILAVLFLLPGRQNWDKSETRSKVVLLLDVTGSMASKDDLPSEAMPVEKLLTRQDKVIRFLTGDQVAFLKRLEEQNPVVAYRFGSGIDEEFKEFDPDVPPWTVEEWNTWLKPEKVEIPNDADEEQRAKLAKQADLQVRLVNNTNVGDSLLAVLNREANNMVQGIIVVSDGRSTQFSTQTFDEVRARSQKTKVPIFAVAVGEHREPINIRITDLQAPDQARPDDKFPVRVDIDGEGLADHPVEVYLDVTKPGGEKVTLRPNLLPGESAKFKPGEPPHVQVEFEIDKPEKEGEWKLVARVPKDRREAFIPKEHVTDPTTVTVVKKPLRVLLFGGAPTRDYQFLRTLLVREVDAHRAEMSIYLQLARADIVQDVAADRLLRQFPTYYRAEDDPKEKLDDRYENLAQYDLIVAFDPDWTLLTPEQVNNLERWVGDGGGLIAVGGPVNTFQLARGLNYEHVKPILDLFPVVLEDSRRQDRPSTEPWRLNFPGATPEMEFLKLDEETKEPLAGWEEFFTGEHGGKEAKEPGLRRGFYNYYPVRAVKPGANVIATFADPRARLESEQGTKEQPYFVTMPYKSGKVFYISSGEMWRLRQYREAYHERFWTKLCRFVGSGNLSRAKSHGRIYMARVLTANHYSRLEAHLRGADMEPLAKTEKPRVQIKAPAGVAMTTAMDLQPKPSQGSGWDGWFAGRFLPTAPGNYELQLQIPGTADVLTEKFVVKEANPELDNTRPDFEQLRQVASSAGDVLLRVKDDDRRARVKSELERTNKVQVKDPSADEAEGLKLYFDLRGAEVIPECMKKETRTRRSLGAVKDLWDAGFPVQNVPVVGSFVPPDRPMKLSYAMLVIIGLLSIEWLTRKLLKLA